ncbi:MAG TPA: hypothetical protein VG712_05425, partial [Gemmatimonadales bacterium]|nr:hypothetical protein [Gemmatimonadales bacterium]
MRPYLALAVLSTLAARVAAQAAPSVPRADSAYQWVQRERDLADSAIARGDASGVARLRRVLDWLGSPTGRDLAQGDPWFGSREANVYYDLAVAALRGSDTAAALTALEGILRSNGGAGYPSLLAQEPLFARLAGNPRFEDLRARFRMGTRLWRDSAFVSPYHEGLTDAEKVAGLSLFWSEARLNFPGALYRGPRVDIDSLYLAT